MWNKDLSAEFNITSKSLGGMFLTLSKIQTIYVNKVKRNTILDLSKKLGTVKRGWKFAIQNLDL
jgi:hypothetical protein